MSEEQRICDCGEKLSSTTMICPKCKSFIEPLESPKKGMEGNRKSFAERSKYSQSSGEVSDRSSRATFWLCFFFGLIGAHRFYAGKIGSAIAYVFLGGFYAVFKVLATLRNGLGRVSIFLIIMILAIWLVDLIRIAVGHFKDHLGRDLE